jgi:hypothetical protein
MDGLHVVESTAQFIRSALDSCATNICDVLNHMLSTGQNGARDILVDSLKVGIAPAQEDQAGTGYIWQGGDAVQGRGGQTIQQYWWRVPAQGFRFQVSYMSSLQPFQ